MTFVVNVSCCTCHCIPCFYVPLRISSKQGHFCITNYMYMYTHILSRLSRTYSHVKLGNGDYYKCAYQQASLTPVAVGHVTMLILGHCW